MSYTLLFWPCYSSMHSSVGFISPFAPYLEYSSQPNHPPSVGTYCHKLFHAVPASMPWGICDTIRVWQLSFIFKLNSLRHALPLNYILSDDVLKRMSPHHESNILEKRLRWSVRLVNFLIFYWGFDVLLCCSIFWSVSFFCRLVSALLSGHVT